LSQNYPNPFNPTTSITYSVPSTQNVELVVYNTLGKEVATLVNEVKSSGQYNVTFNANELPSGVYFYTLNTDAQSLTRKMMLIK